MLGDLVGDIVGFALGLVGAGSAAANGVGFTVVGSIDNVFDII